MFEVGKVWNIMLHDAKGKKTRLKYLLTFICCRKYFNPIRIHIIPVHKEKPDKGTPQFLMTHERSS